MLKEMQRQRISQVQDSEVQVVAKVSVRDEGRAMAKVRVRVAEAVLAEALAEADVPGDKSANQTDQAGSSL